MEPVVLSIFGSSRSDGNTRAALDAVLDGHESEVIDLSDHEITPYRYDHSNQDDDFIPIAEKMAVADVLIFSTPVYWYAMSAQLKTFVDRFSDLLRIRKDLGRALAGKRIYVVSSGADVSYPDGWEMPFENTCQYMDMQYQGAFYLSAPDSGYDEDSLKTSAKEFGDRIFTTQV